MRGHVRQRGSKWCFVVDLPPGLDGKRKQQWKGGFASRKQAEQALVEMLHSVDQGTFVARDRILLAEYLSDWLDGLQLAPASVCSYRKSLRRHGIRTIGHVELQQLDPTTLRRLYALLQTDDNATKRGVSGTSVQLVHQVLHRALNDAAREGLVVRNVAALVKPPRRTTEERETWSAAQLRQFLTSVQDEYDYALWLLLATTGMPRGETRPRGISSTGATNASTHRPPRVTEALAPECPDLLSSSLPIRSSVTAFLASAWGSRHARHIRRRGDFPLLLKTADAVP